MSAHGCRYSCNRERLGVLWLAFLVRSLVSGVSGVSAACVGKRDYDSYIGRLSDSSGCTEYMIR